MSGMAWKRGWMSEESSDDQSRSVILDKGILKNK